MSILFKNLFGKPTDLRSIYLDGAIILDVRTTQEYRSGHVEGALNIPLDALQAGMGDLKKSGKAVITCCLSGARSGAAVKLLTQSGIVAYNGGAWTSLEKIIKSART